MDGSFSAVVAPILPFLLRSRRHAVIAELNFSEGTKANGRCFGKCLVFVGSKFKLEKRMSWPQRIGSPLLEVAVWSIKSSGCKCFYDSRREMQLHEQTAENAGSFSLELLPQAAVESRSSAQRIYEGGVAFGPH